VRPLPFLRVIRPVRSLTLALLLICHSLISEGSAKLASVPSGGASSGAAPAAAGSAPAAAEEKKEEKVEDKEESDDDMGFGLFD
jgi:large subunit ribosomal protein LP2